MNTPRKTRGITLIGFLIGLAVLGFFAYMAMRLIPMYNEYLGVVKAMEQLRSEMGSRDMTIDQIRRNLDVKFDVQNIGVDAIPPGNITLKREGGVQVLHIGYERRAPFVYNLEFVGKFEKSIRLDK